MCSQSVKNISAYDYYICGTSDIFTCSNCHESAPAMPGYTGAIKRYFKVIANGNRLCINCLTQDFDTQFKSYVKGLVPQYNVNALQNLKNNKFFYINCPLIFFMEYIDPSEESKLTSNFKCCVCLNEFSRRSPSYWRCCVVGDHCLCSNCEKKIQNSELNGHLCPICKNKNNPMQEIVFANFENSKNSIDQKIDKIIKDGSEVY